MSVSKNKQLLSADKKLNDLSNIKEFINTANSRLDAITSITNNSHAIAADAVTAMICENQDSLNSKISLNTTNKMSVCLRDGEIILRIVAYLLFSNDDKLSKQIIESGKKVDEKVWRMPLDKNYDKLMDSKNADMQNINYVGGAGSTTAAQFLQRFIINKTPWAHLDIAGMAFSKYGGALNSGGATGYGVRLLNKLIEDNYE